MASASDGINFNDHNFMHAVSGDLPSEPITVEAMNIRSTITYRLFAYGDAASAYFD